MLFKGEKTVVPESLKQNMLSLIHEVHLGVQKSLYRARQSLFWPTVTQEVKGMARTVQRALNIGENSRKSLLCLSKYQSYHGGE